MGNIIDQKSINITTFRAIQTVKYTLKSRKLSAVDMFRWGDSRWFIWASRSKTVWEHYFGGNQGQSPATAKASESQLKKGGVRLPAIH